MKTVCVGGACVDRKYLVPTELQFGTSNPVRARRGFGGVARNVAENLVRLGTECSLIGVVGNDENGVALLDNAERCGIDTHMVMRDLNHVTPEYAAVVSPGGDLIAGLADMSALETFGVADMERLWSEIELADWLFVDCNLAAGVLEWTIRRARDSHVRLAIDAVSEPKVCKLPDDLSGTDLFILNEKEAAVYLYEDVDAYRARPVEGRTAEIHARGVKMTVITMGSRGALVSDGTVCEMLPAVPAQVIDATGASDALSAGVLYGLLRGESLLEGARIGTVAAALTIESAATVRSDLTPALIELHARHAENPWIAR